MNHAFDDNEEQNPSGVKPESPRPAQQNPLPCGCGIKGTPYVGAYGSEYELRQEYKNMFIDFCPLHKAADALVEALRKAQTALYSMPAMPSADDLFLNRRKEVNEQIVAALKLAEGKQS